ncbi:AAA family ATPase [Ensifer sp. B1-9]|uniref:ATP-dependent nuclease n=1 Tax=Ensifer sp. B1-9 TaxID=3141455 RepID=UPI003D24BFB1
MRLKQFRVTNFRSVEDSGWIEAEKVTALIGVNESGKTNLLLPLWKLKPARDGEIQPTSDFPKTMFGAIRNAPGEYCFIEADFWTGVWSSKIAAKAGITEDQAKIVRVRRSYDGEYHVEFPNHQRQTSVPRTWLIGELESCASKIEAGQALKQEADLQADFIAGVKGIACELPADQTFGASALSTTKTSLDALVPAEPAKTSAIVPIIKQLSDLLAETIARISAPQPGENEGVVSFVVTVLPSFVYYSNYGNLDSEIYLPHVVENLKRDDLGAKEAAKARTLRVLFSFVQLEPEEILELGRDFKDIHGQNREPSAAEIAQIAEKKRTRSILLQSAGATLTQKFRDWWKQGDYRFRFEADGSHFRIWVADDRRPTEVELENRSTGLQWFLSFYLVFLVESHGDHKRSILLLDEPGMSLHPLAQRDLSAFFDSLADTNQILYTSHSPFLVDADRLERARKVYVASNGTTKATANLRHNEGKDDQAGAAYAVHSALNLSVAESLLVGCQPILVEGASDQHYLASIKSLLLSAGRIKPKRELVFPPCGGAKTARVVASILTGRDETLPKVLLDSDAQGKRFADTLRAELYASNPERVLSVADFVGFGLSEIEDLFPPEYLAAELDRMEREPEERLSDVVKVGEPFVGQAEAWAKRQGISLDPYWKVHLAIRVKQRALSRGISDFSDELVGRWEIMFNAFD